MAINLNILEMGSGSRGVQGTIAKYANAAGLPGVANDGDVAIVLDTNNLYSYDTGVGGWVIIGGPGVAMTITDTNSVDLTLTLNVLSADARYAGATSVANYSGVTLQTLAGSTPGIFALVPGFRVGEQTSSVLQFSGNSFPVLGTSFGIQVNQSSGSTSGYLSSTDWTTFNAKVGISAILQTVFPILGGTNIPASGGITLSIPVGNGSTGGYISAADWTTFNAKLGTGSTIAQLGNIAATSILGNVSGSPAGITTLSYTAVKVALGISGTNLGDVTLGSFLAATSAVGATISAAQVLSFTEGQTGSPGMVSSNAQTWTGAKRFVNDLQIDTFLKLAGGSMISIGSSAQGGYTLMMPLSQGSLGTNLRNSDGLGNLVWSMAEPGNYLVVTNAGATLTLNNRFIEITTGSTNQTLNCAWSSGNTGVYFNVMKIDSGLGTVTVQDPNLINGVTNFTFSGQWESHQFVSNGVGLRVLS